MHAWLERKIPAFWNFCRRLMQLIYDLYPYQAWILKSLKIVLFQDFGFLLGYKLKPAETKKPANLPVPLT